MTYLCLGLPWVLHLGPWHWLHFSNIFLTFIHSRKGWRLKHALHLSEALNSPWSQWKHRGWPCDFWYTHCWGYARTGGVPSKWEFACSELQLWCHQFSMAQEGTQHSKDCDYHQQMSCSIHKLSLWLSRIRRIFLELRMRFRPTCTLCTIGQSWHGRLRQLQL